MGPRKKQINDLADKLQAELIKRGFTIHRYRQVRNNCITLRLDYGACGTIRVAEKPVDKMVRCNWNIGPYITEGHVIRDGRFVRSFFTIDQCDELVHAICLTRDYKKSRNRYQAQRPGGKCYGVLVNG